jgi:hypothetical protein
MSLLRKTFKAHMSFTQQQTSRARSGLRWPIHISACFPVYGRLKIMMGYHDRPTTLLVLALLYRLKARSSKTHADLMIK